MFPSSIPRVVVGGEGRASLVHTISTLNHLIAPDFQEIQIFTVHVCDMMTSSKEGVIFGISHVPSEYSMVSS